MKNTLWSFGCSFTAEYHPLNETPPNNYDLYREFKGGSLPPVWPTLLSTKLNLNNQNKGIGASSNYTIFQQFCKYCSELKSDDIVIVGWTSIYRFPLAETNTHMLDLLPSCSYSNFDKKILDYLFVNRTHDIWKQEIVRFTQIMIEICKEKNVKILFWSFTDDLIKYLHNSEEISDYFLIFDKNVKNNDYSVYQSITNSENINENDRNYTIIEETNRKIEDYHMGQYGHERQSEYFYNWINKTI